MRLAQSVIGVQQSLTVDDLGIGHQCVHGAAQIVLVDPVDVFVSVRATLLADPPLRHLWVLQNCLDVGLLRTK